MAAVQFLEQSQHRACVIASSALVGSSASSTGGLVHDGERDQKALPLPGTQFAGALVEEVASPGNCTLSSSPA